MTHLCFNCGTRFSSEAQINQHTCDEELQKRDASTEKQIENSIDAFVCCQCGTRFSSKRNQQKHQNVCNKPLKTAITECKICKQQFTSYRSRLNHEKRWSNQSSKRKVFTCNVCNSEFDRVSALVKHQAATQHVTASGSRPTPSTSTFTSNYPHERLKDVLEDDKIKTVKCRKCNFTCKSFSELYDHRALIHAQSNQSSFQSVPWTEDDQHPPWLNDDGTVDENLKRCYLQHRHLILKEKKTELTTLSRYNFPTTRELNMDQLRQHIEEIYERNSSSFKINLCLGLILRNANDGQYRYFAPYSNENIFDLPMLISNRTDIERYLRRLSELDILNYMFRQRPDTVWKPLFLCNVVYTVYRTAFPLGNSKLLPNYIRKRKSIISLYSNPKTGKVYEDDLCMFRCIAYHKTKTIEGIESLTKCLYSEWLEYVKKMKLRTSDVSITKIPDVENCFSTSINVYCLNSDKTVDVIYKSMQKYQNTVNLNLHESHLSYVTNFKRYALKLRCNMCDMMFPTLFRLNRHMKVCKKTSRLKFPGGYYKQKQTIFEKLEEWHIFVKPELRNFPYFAVFDMESILVPERVESETNRRLYNSHKPICVCVSSNVPGYTKEKFILDENTSTMLKEMCSYLTTISLESQRLARDRWKHVIKALNKLENKWNDENNVDIDDDINENEHISDNDYHVDNTRITEAKDSNEYEPPSAEFLHKISKENVWHRFMQDISSNESAQVQYNDWSDTESDVSSSTTSVSTIDEDDTDGDDDYDDYEYEDSDNSNSDDDEYIRPVILGSRKRRCFDSDSEGDQMNDYTDNSDQKMRKLNENSEYDTNADSDNDNYSMTSDIQHNTNNTSTVVRELMKVKVQKLKSDFEKYCQQLPVIGFNSGKYDINLIKTELPLHLGLHKSKGQKFILKKSNNYICIGTNKLKFLDMTNYLPANTSHDAFLKSFDVPIRKSYFPYEYFTDISKLNETCLPSKESFYSCLKKCNTLENKMCVNYTRLIKDENKTSEEALKILQISEIPCSSIDENYGKLQQIWVEKNMKTLKDFLQYYAELDVGPMVQGIQTYQHFFFDKCLDVFKDFVSVPGIARKMLYNQGQKSGAAFSLLDKFDTDLHETFMNNMAGGPSIIFTRHHKVDETFVRGDRERPCKSIFGYDANSLYLFAIAQAMPVGRYIRRKCENNFYPQNKVKRYYAMYDWMDWISHSKSKVIEHKMNSGRECRIVPYYVDGKSKNTDEVYEFLGFYFHKCPCLKSRNEKDIEIYNKTVERLKFIEDQGFEVNYIWECDYRKQLKENESMRNFIQKKLPIFYQNYPRAVKQDQIIEGIINDSLFGFVEVDIQIPDTWDQVNFKPNTELSPYEYFQEMCPLFVTTEVPFSSIGKHMLEHAKEFNLSQLPRQLLVGGLRAKKIMLLTPLLKWYISHGMLATKIHQVVEYCKKSCFKEFCEEVTQAHREGDNDDLKKIIALLFKLIGNSAFGGTIMNKEKHKRHKYVKGYKKACIEVNNSRFDSLNEFNNEIYEVELRKSQITMDNPVILGLAILNLAKLHLLRFYYEFMDVYIGRDNFECIECDTDAIYFCLTKSSIPEAIRSDRKKKFMSKIYEQCDDNYNIKPGENHIWLPRECCSKHFKYDLRTPGLMKKEFEASKMIGLSSKSYVAKNDASGEVKYSLKGVNKGFVDPTDKYEHVLSNQTSITATNGGINVHNNKMYSYVQQKKAFSYFYCKREVCEDGIHTKPLNIILQPTKRK